MWIPKRPLKEIDNEEVKNIFIEEAKYLLKDLETNHLEVEVIDAPEPRYKNHGIRNVKNKNPEWYKKLWREYIYYYKNKGERKINRKKQFKRKKPDSYIRRKYGIVPALTRLINQKDKIRVGEKGFPKDGYTLDYILRDLIFERLTEGYIEGGCYIPQNVIVCNYLNVELNERTKKILRNMKKSETEEIRFEKIMNFFDKIKNEQ